MKRFVISSIMTAVVVLAVIAIANRIPFTRNIVAMALYPNAA